MGWHKLLLPVSHEAWPIGLKDFTTMCQLIEQKDFAAVGDLAESKALAMWYDACGASAS